MFDDVVLCLNFVYLIKRNAFVFSIQSKKLHDLKTILLVESALANTFMISVVKDTLLTPTSMVEIVLVLLFSVSALCYLLLSLSVESEKLK